VLGPTPAAGIVDHAKKEGADIIVMATRGHGVFHQVVMGSSARGVVASAPCSVLCVKPGEKGMLDEGSGSIDIKRILIPSDASKHSLKASRVGAALAREHGAEVTVLYVSETQVPPMYQAAGIESMFSLDSDLPSRIREHLENLLSEMDIHGKSPDIIEIREGSPSKEIARFADQFDADLIVISRKGFGDTPHLLGGVTERLLHDAKHPMLVV
jgi:nucleotide-binding universal stress UspA family protein